MHIISKLVIFNGFGGTLILKRSVTGSPIFAALNLFISHRLNKHVLHKENHSYHSSTVIVITAVKMSKIQSVKPLLSAAADEILKDVEKIIAGYEEEMFQSKRKISRQRKMIHAPKPEIKLNTTTGRLCDISDWCAHRL